MPKHTASPAAGSAPAPLRITRPHLVALTPATHGVLELIRSIGGRPMVVGGSVRDAVLRPGARPKDIDIEVYDVADINHLVLSLGALGRVDEVGKSFGVLKMTLRDGTDLDISLPRRDSKTGTGHRGFTIEVSADITEAEATGRRDFTVNALMWDPFTLEVVDYWGGLADLDAGVLRHCTDAFADDPLRVLRGIQFAARFGFTMATATIELSRSLTGEFDQLAADRVWGEWKKMLAKGTHFPRALSLLEATGWLAHFPELAATRGVEQDEHWHPEGDVFTHLGLAAAEAAAAADRTGLAEDDRVVVVAAALLHDLGKATHTVHETDGRITSHGHAEAGVEPARAMLRSLGAPLDVMNRVSPLVAEHMCATTVIGSVSRAAVRRLARRLSPATVAEWSLVCGADQAGRGTGAKENNTLPWLAVAETLGVERAPEPLLVKGHHLMALGHKPSPAFKGVMEKALEAQDNDEFSDEAGALEWLHHLNETGLMAQLLDEARERDEARYRERERVKQELRDRMKAERPARRAALRAEREAHAAGELAGEPANPTVLVHHVPRQQP